MRVAVSGASGWLGRELCSRLINDPAKRFDLLPLGHTPKVVYLRGGGSIYVQAWDVDLVKIWEPDVFVHLAFVTRDRLQEFGEEEFRRVNEGLTDKALSCLHLPSLRGVMLASSGAAVQSAPDLYGRLKARDEHMFAETSQQLGVPLVTARAWSLTGAQCTKPESFLFYDLLRQLIGPSDLVRISSANPVLRRYMDGGEFLEICLTELLLGNSGTYDSHGELLEAAQAVERMGQVLGVEKCIERPAWRSNERANAYFTFSDAVLLAADRQGRAIADFEHQVLSSLPAVLPR